MPTPPPWWSDTQVAPDAVLRRALRSGQSETASDPSFIASVSRLGLATEPLSRWSRPMTTGAFSSPLDTISLTIGRPHVCTPITNEHHVCRLLLEKQNDISKDAIY